MNSNISRISEVMEDIKENITDNQYKIIMDSLMEINKKPILDQNYSSNRFIHLFQWLDTQIIRTDDRNNWIRRNDLHKFIVTEYFDNNYYENIEFIRNALKIYFTHPTKKHDSCQEYGFVKFIERQDD